ncbi:unnamed protein product, partial [Pocillopora meandrina]
CDGKGPSVTIIRVGKYIFGGYTSYSWIHPVVPCPIRRCLSINRTLSNVWAVLH